MPAPIIAGTDLGKRKKGKHSRRNGAPDPTGGNPGDIGQYIYDPDCRYSTTDHENDCRDIFGPEWGYGGSGHHFDPYGHEDGIGAHFHCPAGGFYHKCERKKHTGNKYDCCVRNIHENNKSKTDSPTCETINRGPMSEGCYSTVRTYCSPQSTIQKTIERANTATCKEFCTTKGDKCHQMWKKICHTKTAHDLKSRFKNPDCYKYFWQYSVPTPGKNTAPFYNKWENVASTVELPVKDILDSEQQEYCFKTVNGKYVNIDKNFVDLNKKPSDWEGKIPQVKEVFDCRDLCVRSKDQRNVNYNKSFPLRCERAWNGKCNELGFDKYGSSNVLKIKQPLISEDAETEIDYTKLCPVFWDRENVKLTKVGELIDQAKEQKPDKCSFAALTQLDWKDSGVQPPICWHPEISAANNKLFQVVLPPGQESRLEKLKAVCPSNNYNVCCQNIKLGSNVASKNVNIKQNCKLPELQDPNTITGFEGYALRVPWLAPPFKPDPKCEETPRPTGVVCTEPKPYKDFSNWLEDQITFDADEVVSILNENWERKEEAEKNLLDDLVADIVAKTKDEKEREPTSPPEEKTWWERLIEWFRKIFGLGKEKTLEELQEESDKKLEEVEEFTDVNVNDDIHITNTHVIIIIFISLLILYVIYKFFSNKSVQQGIGMGVGMGIGEEIYDNRDNIASAASGLFEQAKNIGARVGEEIYDNRDNIASAASGLFEQVKNYYD